MDTRDWTPGFGHQGLPLSVSVHSWRKVVQGQWTLQRTQSQVPRSGSVRGGAAVLRVLRPLGGRLQPEDTPDQPRLGGQAVVHRYRRSQYYYVLLLQYYLVLKYFFFFFFWTQVRLRPLSPVTPSSCDSPAGRSLPRPRPPVKPGDRDAPGRRSPNLCSCLSTRLCLTASETRTDAGRHSSVIIPPPPPCPPPPPPVLMSSPGPQWTETSVTHLTWDQQSGL